MSLKDHSAPGVSAGFIFQFERALSWLAKSPAGSIVGIETDDDVSVRGPRDATSVYEQDKHSVLPRAKPFGDRSKDLWNTIATWVAAVQQGEIAVELSSFHMVTNKVLPDCIAKQIDKATTKEQVATCVLALIEAGKTPSKGIAELVAAVLDPSARDSLNRVIANCSLADGSMATSGAALRKATLDHLQLPAWCDAHKDSIADELLGWMQKTALARWQLNQPAWLARDHFVNQVHAIIERRRREIVRERAQHLIPIDDDSVGRARGRPFVRQLHLITDDDPVVDIAIREFIQCNIEKARLSGEGNVTDADWIAFENSLLTRWEKISARVARMTKKPDERDIGYEIFSDTTESHCEKLAGSETEQVYLTSGSYHRLADSLRVGWHPRFKTLLSTEAP